MFIRDRREPSVGVRVRSSAAPVYACAYQHKRAEELGIFSEQNLVLNGSFRATKGSEELASFWSLDGPVDALSVLGGQGVAVGKGGKLWQHVQVKPNGRYVLYSRLAVIRGSVVWSLKDNKKGEASKGQLKTGIIKEIVSDVLVSPSGALEVSFTSPEGGAFRILDVIITELKPAVPTETQTVKNDSR